MHIEILNPKSTQKKNHMIFVFCVYVGGVTLLRVTFLGLFIYMYIPEFYFCL